MGISIGFSRGQFFTRRSMRPPPWSCRTSGAEECWILLAGYDIFMIPHMVWCEWISDMIWFDMTWYDDHPTLDIWYVIWHLIFDVRFFLVYAQVSWILQHNGTQLPHGFKVSMAHPERVGSSWKSFVANLRVGKNVLQLGSYLRTCNVRTL